MKGARLTITPPALPRPISSRGQVKYEFEDFIAVRGCRKGYHDDASGDFTNPPPAA